MAKVFEAMYHGHCAVCDDDIEVGDEVTYDDDELVHADCADDADGLTLIRRRPKNEGPGNPPRTFL